MSVKSPVNKELKDLESFLDDDCANLVGSDFHSRLETIYDDLDDYVTEYKSAIEELRERVEELEGRLEELE